MNEINKSIPKLQALKNSGVDVLEFNQNNSDLSNLIGLKSIYNRKEYHITLKDTSFVLNYSFPDNVLLRFHNKTINGSGKKLMLFGDSFSAYMIPFLNMNFEETVFIRNSFFMANIIEQEKPDVVVFESLERLMYSTFLHPNPSKLNSEEK